MEEHGMSLSKLSMASLLEPLNDVETRHKAFVDALALIWQTVINFLNKVKTVFALLDLSPCFVEFALEWLISLPS